MKKILIVDDAPIVLKIVEIALTAEGYQVVKASNADEALAMLQKERFDIGVFDVNMPGKSGIELTREVLAVPNGKDMKIVMLTTESSEDMKAKGREAGAKGWLVKPFMNDDLITLLSKLG